MNIEKLIPLALALSLLAASTGHIREATLAVRKAQMQLILDSKASKWGNPFVLRSNKINSDKHL